MYGLFSALAVTPPPQHVIVSETVPDGFHLLPDPIADHTWSRLQWFKQLTALARQRATERPDLNAIHGSVLIDAVGRGILCIAERSGGKSATAAAWAERMKLSVLCDDLVILRGDVAYVGPRLLPVRPNTAHALGLTPTDSAVLLNDAPLMVPIRSGYLLRTGPTAAMEQLTSKQVEYEISRRLFDNATLTVVLDALAGLPFYRLTRHFTEPDHTWTARQIHTNELAALALDQRS